jgi:hypothetical protein
MQAQSNVKTIVKSSVSGQEKMTHHPVRHEISYKDAKGNVVVEKFKVA